MINVVCFDYNDEEELIANAFIAVDSKKQCVVIDPSSDYDGLINYINKNKLSLKAILLTHTHFDHMKGVNRLLNVFNVPLYVHFDDVPGLTDPNINFSSDQYKKVIIEKEPSIISDNDVINALEEKIIVMHTPYHSVGSVCYYLKDSKILFSGDTLFKMTIGRADFATSIKSERHNTFAKLMALPDEVKVYPGHGRNTTIGDEIRMNPFVRR